MVGNSGPVSTDYVERIAQAAGVPDEALKVSIHKACDGSVAGLNLALNPGLPYNQQLRPEPGRVAHRQEGAGGRHRGAQPLPENLRETRTPCSFLATGRK